MATTLTELEQRVQALEEQVLSLLEMIRRISTAQLPEAKLREADSNLALDEIYRQMGISGEAPGIEKLRVMLAAHGVHPGDEIVRQEIAALYEQEQDE